MSEKLMLKFDMPQINDIIVVKHLATKIGSTTKYSIIMYTNIDTKKMSKFQN